MSNDFIAKFNKLRNLIKEKAVGYESLVIMFSGGLDSTLLSIIAQEELGDKALAVFIDDETVPSYIKRRIEDIVQRYRINLKIIPFSALSNDNFVKNDLLRCYYCKLSRGSLLKKVFPNSLIADGTNTDDLRDYRPGLRASKELGIWHPYVEAGISKNDIRAYARYIELPIWDAPSESCLATRVAYNIKLTKDLLEKIDRAEEFLRRLGFRVVRARVFSNNLLKIEVGNDEVDRLLSNEIRTQVVKYMKELGFAHITLDLEGYVSGKMNKGITT